jgi:excisionase family DNA binding protein
VTTNASPDDILTLEEAARALRVSISTVRRRIRCGDLHAYRMGGRRLWVRRGDLEGLMARSYTGVDVEEDADDEEGDLDGSLTSEEQQQWFAALAAAAELAAEIARERKGRRFRPSEDVLAEIREARLSALT